MKTREYELKVLAYLYNRKVFVRAKRLSSELGIPTNYAAKVCQSLAKKKLLLAVRGRTGGYQINKDQIEKMKLSDFVGDVLCPLGADSCILWDPDVGRCCHFATDCGNMKGRLKRIELKSFLEGNYG